jgi:hypothetical protein
MTTQPKQIMGIFEILTVAFVTLKLTGIIHWTWLQVLSPSIFAFLLGVFEGIMEVIVENLSKEKND